MCIIIDANVGHKCFCTPPHVDFQPIVRWLQSDDGALALGGEVSKEITRSYSGAIAFLAELNRTGKAKVYSTEELEIEARSLVRSGALRSDDPHVIALARVSRARVLCSEDINLHADFTNPSLINHPRGSVYQYATHEHLLRRVPNCRDA